VAGVKAAAAEAAEPQKQSGQNPRMVNDGLNPMFAQGASGCRRLWIAVGENPGSGAKFYAGLPLALSELANPSPGSWGLQPYMNAFFA
jgi:hypothetical protein